MEIAEGMGVRIMVTTLDAISIVFMANMALPPTDYQP
jgi:hypothetical protein